MGVHGAVTLAQLSLPPGFRFYPTDEELMVQYLCRKVAGHKFSLQIISEIDLYKFDPWVLPSKAMFGEKEWYFFSPRDRKYPNGSRPNRVAGSGYWKATGTDKVISNEGRTVGIKKALVFYVGKAPKGTKTNWIMHEYRLIESLRKKGSTKLDDWVLCRIYKKNSGSQKQLYNETSRKFSNNGSSTSCSNHLDDVLDSVQEIGDGSFDIPDMSSSRTLRNDDKFGLDTMDTSEFDWASLAGLNSFDEDGLSLMVPSHVHSNGCVTGKAEDEMQSGFISQRHNNSGTVQRNSAELTQGFGSNTIDPCGFRFATQLMGFGFMQ